MTCFIARFKVKPGSEPDFERLETEFSRLSVAQEAGTLVYDVLRHRTETGSYVLYARFRDDDAFQEHQRTDLYARLVPQILALVGAETDLQFYDWVG